MSEYLSVISTAAVAGVAFPSGLLIAGESEESRVISRSLEGLCSYLHQSASLGHSSTFTELNELVDKVSEPNWDGFDALPVQAATYYLAYAFLEALPLGITSPSVGAEADGHLTFEWYHSPYRLLSVSIAPDGDLHYAAILGSSKRYGTEPFWGEVPEELIRLIEGI